MKKILSMALCMMLLVLCFTATAHAEMADPEDFTRIVATGQDPIGELNLDMALNPDVVKWAVVCYRLNTPLDSKGIGYIGQFYTYPAAEPNILIHYDTDNYGVWNTVVVDMTSNESNTELPSRWTSTLEGGDFSKIRFDALEVNRNDPFYGGEILEATHVKEGDNIDIAWIAFFDDEAKANAFDGTQDTYVTIVSASAIYDMTGDRFETFAKDELEGGEPDSSTEESTDESADESADASTDASAEESADASTEESKTEVSAEESKAETSADKSEAASENASSVAEEESGSNVGLIIGIIAAVVVIAVVVVVILKKKK